MVLSSHDTHTHTPKTPETGEHLQLYGRAVMQAQTHPLPLCEFIPRMY